MKRLLGIVILCLFLSLSSFAEDNIYYCSDDQAVGFNASTNSEKDPF